MKVIFVNDKAIYNIRYRYSLMNFFNAKGYNIESIGVLDSPLRSFFAIFNSRKLIISSNLKSNLLTLIVNPINYIIILNGLGRFRRSSLLRSCMVLLTKNQSKVFINHHLFEIWHLLPPFAIISLYIFVINIT